MREKFNLFFKKGKNTDIISMAEKFSGDLKESFDEKLGKGASENRGEAGELLYERKWQLNDPLNPELGRKYDYEKSFEYDENGFCKKEFGQDLLPEKKGNAWSKEFKTNESGEMEQEVGGVTKGPDQGHKWEKIFRQEVLPDGKRVKIEQGLVSEQGSNKEKEMAGHQWESYEILDDEDNVLFRGGRHIVGADSQPSDSRYGDWQKINELLKIE